MRRIAAIFLLLCFHSAFFVSTPVQAHALDPGYLELRFVSTDIWHVSWRKPDVQGRPMQIEPLLPKQCQNLSTPKSRFDGKAWVSLWTIRCLGGLSGASIEILGLDQQATDVLLRYQLSNDRSQTVRLSSSDTAITIANTPSLWRVLKSYISLGFDHIIYGFDHLLFVFALMLLVRRLHTLIVTVTLFTVGHSFSLAAAALGWLNIPGPPVEATIALSIMFIAAEALRANRSEMTITQKNPWIVSFGFGLLHGLGFGSALVEIGLPEEDILAALFAFNVGVEIGQIAFIFIVMVMYKMANPIMPSLQSTTSKLTLFLLYAVGSTASFWFIQRIESAYYSLL